MNEHNERSKKKSNTTEKEPPRPRGTGGIHHMKNSKYLWVSYRFGGKRFFENTHSTRETDAQKLLTDRLADAQRGLAITPKMGRKRLKAGLEDVIADMKLNQRVAIADAQRRIDKHLLRHLATDDEPEGGFFHPDLRMATLTTSDLTAYGAHRLKQGASRASVNQELHLIRRAFRLAIRAGELMHAPHVPMLSLNNTRKGFVDLPEFEALNKALPEALRGVVTFAYFSGWRIKSEVLKLTWAQVDRVTKTVRLEPGTTKNRDARVLPYGAIPELDAVIETAWRQHKALEAEEKISSLVFHRRGKRIADFRDAWRTACEAAGVVGLIPHDLRRSAVRNLVRAGVSEKIAMTVSGHRTSAVFQRYNITTESDLRTATDRLATWTAEQRVKVRAHRKGELRKFKKQQRAAS